MSIKKVGQELKAYNKKLQKVIRDNPGLLSSIDRTRGALTSQDALQVPFTIERENRKVTLKIAFYPLTIIPAVQGAFDSWYPGEPIPASPTLPVKTTPGTLLFVIYSLRPYVVGTLESQVQNHPVFTPYDSTWHYWHYSAGNSAIGIAARYVQDNERTFNPLVCPTDTGGNTGQGIWLWEIPRAKIPNNSTFYQSDSAPANTVINIGDPMNGWIVGAFAVNNSPNYPTPHIIDGKTFRLPYQIIKNLTGQASTNADQIPYLYDGVVADLAPGWNINCDVANGNWIKTTLQTVTNVGTITLYRNQSGAFSGGDNNPTARLDLSDGTSINIPATGMGSYTINVSLTAAPGDTSTSPPYAHNISWFTVTFTANGFGSGIFGPYKSGYSEIAVYKLNPSVRQVFSVDSLNNPTFPGAGWHSPWVYVGQQRNGVVSVKIDNSYDHLSSYRAAGISVVIPGIRSPLLPIPYPADYFYQASGGITMADTLYASGVRVFIDGQDISQYVFGAPSGVIDESNNRIDDVDISTWVRVPGDHMLTITTDEGGADVDTKFRTI